MSDAALNLAQRIERLSSSDYRTVIDVISLMELRAKSNNSAKASSKRKAFQEMQELRKESSKYVTPDFDYDKERAAALTEKYGSVD